MRNIIHVFGLIGLSILLTSCDKEILCEDELYHVVEDECVLIEVNKSYTVTYHIEGNDQIDDIYLIDTDVDIEQYELEIIELEGSSFSGWFSDVDLTNLVNDLSFITDESLEIHLYGVVGPIKYNVTFMTPDGYPIVAETTISHNTKLVIQDYPTEYDYVWYMDETYETPFNFNKPVIGDITLYLFIEPVEYFITYYSHITPFRTEEYDRVKYNPEDDSLEHPIPEREGYTFVGWYRDKDFTQSISEYPIISDEFNPNTDLYAKHDWNSYTITWVIDGGVDVETTHRFNDLITFYWPSSYGTEIDGWYLDAEYTLKYTDLNMPSEDITLYAKRFLPYELIHYTDIAQMEEEYVPGHIVQLTGIVSLVMEYGYFVTDGVRNIFVNRYEEITVSIGDKIKVEGSLTSFHYTIELGQSRIIETLETGLTNPIDLLPATIEEISQFSFGDSTQIGMQYTITGKLQMRENGFIIKDGDFEVPLFLQDNLITKHDLSAFFGEIITINVVYIGYRISFTDYYFSDLYNTVTITVSADEIILVEEMDNLEAINEDIEWFNSRYSPYVTSIYSLYTMGPNGTIFSNFVSSHPEYLNTQGVFYSFPSDPTEINVDFGATRGDTTISTSITTTFLIRRNLGEVLELTDTDILSTYGFIYAVGNDGYYIYDVYSEEYMYVINQIENYTPALGDYVHIQGSWVSSIFYADYIQFMSTTRAYHPFTIYSTIQSVYDDLHSNGSVVAVTALVDYDELTGITYLIDPESDSILVVDSLDNDDLFIEFDGMVIEVVLVVGFDNTVIVLFVEESY